MSVSRLGKYAFVLSLNRSRFIVSRFYLATVALENREVTELCLLRPPDVMCRLALLLFFVMPGLFIKGRFVSSSMLGTIGLA